MNPRTLGMLVVLSALTPISSEAENLLTYNSDFDSGPTTYFAGIQTNDNGQVPFSMVQFRERHTPRHAKP